MRDHTRQLVRQQQFPPSPRPDCPRVVSSTTAVPIVKQAAASANADTQTVIGSLLAVSSGRGAGMSKPHRSTTPGPSPRRPTTPGGGYIPWQQQQQPPLPNAIPSGRHTSVGFAAAPPRSSAVAQRPPAPVLTDILASSEPQSQEQLYNFVESGCLTPDAVRNLQSRESRLLTDRLDQIAAAAAQNGRPAKYCRKWLLQLFHATDYMPRTIWLSHVMLAPGPPYSGGDFGDLYKGTYGTRAVVIKASRPVDSAYMEHEERAMAKLLKDVYVWKIIEHPNILPFLGLSTKVILGQFSLIIPYCAHGNINEYVLRHPRTDRLRLLAQAANGLAYLHSIRLVHGSIKGLNLLIDDTHRVRITDIGIYHHNKIFNMAFPESSKPSPRWAAPEYFGLQDPKPDAKYDVYAFGMTMYEVIAGQAPFLPDRSTASITSRIRRGERPPRPSGANEGAWRLMVDCWDQDPARRPHMAMVAQAFPR